jgi:competence protein CoiA
MKFALINGQRQEAQPQLSGQCPYCNQALIAKCGEIKMWHWAHKGRRVCDPWWENETEWHRAWKDRFHVDWQEIVHRADDGERHIADVKTRDGWVLEFQHSVIPSDERRSREAFYKSLIWIVDGLSRKKDAQQFYAAWSKGEKTRDPFSTKRRISSPKGALLRDWTGSHAHVFFDFGEEKRLWWLFPESDDLRAYVQDISRQQFVRIHQERTTHGPTEFDELVQNFSAFIATFETPPLTLRPQRPTEAYPVQHRAQIIQRRPRL